MSDGELSIFEIDTRWRGFRIRQGTKHHEKGRASRQFGGDIQCCELSAGPRSADFACVNRGIKSSWQHGLHPEAGAVRRDFESIRSDFARRITRLQEPLDSRRLFRRDIIQHNDDVGLQEKEMAAEVVNAGSVRFEDAPGDEGTEVTVSLEYNPPGGRLA